MGNGPTGNGSGTNQGNSKYSNPDGTTGSGATGNTGNGAKGVAETPATEPQRAPMVEAAKPEAGPQVAEGPVAPDWKRKRFRCRKHGWWHNRLRRTGGVQAAVAERLTKSKTQRQLAWDSRSLRIPG